MKKLIVAAISCSVLSGCGAQIDDLVAYTTQVKQSTQVNIETYPQFTTLEAVDYGAADLRSPFQRIVPQANANTGVAQNENCMQPISNRKKGKLEAYGIDALQMAGVFTSNGQQWALVKANDGSLHRVKRGEYLGLFNGKIQSISATQIIIQEMLPDGAGCWKTKQATLTMSSMTGENDNV